MHQQHLRHLPLLALVLATLAPLHAQTPLLPTALNYDVTGNLYFADTNRHQIFESTLGGSLLLIAGNGTQGYSGDSAPATLATLNSPEALAIGSDGTLYIADTGNHVIRAITTNGIITTIAGTGHPAYSGDNGPAVSAALDTPNALAIDATGALLIADSANHRIRRISSGIIATIAGNGTQGFAGDTGLATAAQLDTPSGIALAPDGRIFIADTHNQRIRIVSITGIITTFAGTGHLGFSGDNAPAISAQLASPRGLIVTASGALLIADANNQRIRSVSPQGIVTTLAGGVAQGITTDGTPALAAAIDTPRGLAITSFGYPVFADPPNRTLRILAADGKLYVPAALSTGRITTLNLNATSAANITITGSVATPQGIVQLLVDNAPTASASLTAGTAAFPLASLTPGVHTLSAAYLGDGLNPAAASPAISITIGRATSAVIMQPPSQNSYAGLPLLLNAHVTSTGNGTPTGTVIFSEATTTIATAQLVAGIASGVYLSPTAGTHIITATYQGDANFSASSAPSITATVRAVPDFTLATSGTTTQTVVAGAIATYGLTLAPIADPFTGVVSLSVTGLPKGSIATFAPPQAVPGAAPVSVAMNIQTLAAVKVFLFTPTHTLYALLALPLFLLRPRRKRAFIFITCIIAIAGCGTRINQPASPSAGIYPLTVTATGTNLAGAVITHTTSVTLNVQ